jgi:hypothetical protein
VSAWGLRCRGRERQGRRQRGAECESGEATATTDDGWRTTEGRAKTGGELSCSGNLHSRRCSNVQGYSLGERKGRGGRQKATTDHGGKSDDGTATQLSSVLDALLREMLRRPSCSNVRSFSLGENHKRERGTGRWIMAHPVS